MPSIAPFRPRNRRLADARAPAAAAAAAAAAGQLLEKLKKEKEAEEEGSDKYYEIEEKIGKVEEKLSDMGVPKLNVSYKPQKISPKFEGTVPRPAPPSHTHTTTTTTTTTTTAHLRRQPTHAPPQKISRKFGGTVPTPHPPTHHPPPSTYTPDTPIHPTRPASEDQPQV